MHASCTICGDIFTGVHPEVVHSTACGHLFHYTCLLEWLQRSKTCPHCRAKVNESNTIRLYFQLSAGVTQDTGTLENKVQSLTFQLAVKESDLKKLTEEARMYKLQNKGLRLNLLKEEEKIRNNETVVTSLQDQIKVLKVQMKSLKEAQLKAEELEAKLEQFKSLEKVLRGSASDAAETLELMKDITDTSVLCACINTLKREMYVLKEKSRDLQGNLKLKESKIISSANEVSRLQEQSSILNRTINKLKGDLMSSEEENERLKKRCANLKEVMIKPETKCGNKSYIGANSTMLNRIMNESPAPQLLDSSIIDLDKSIPIISPQNNNTPTSPLSIKFRRCETKNKMLLSKPRWQQSRSTSDLSEQCFDGFGGRGKEEFSFTDKEAIIERRTKKATEPPIKKSKLLPSCDIKGAIETFFYKKSS